MNPPEFLTAAGHRFAFRRYGTPATSAAPVLVFLHEALGSLGQWRGFPEDLCRATGLAGFAWERLGHGGSDPLEGPRAPGYLDEEIDRWMPGVLDAAGIREAIFVGHSDGATLALMWATARPQRTLGVVAMAPHVYVEALAVEGIRAAAAAWATTSFRDKLARFHGDKTDALFRAWQDVWLSEAFAGWNIEDRLPAVRCPVLLIQGEDDEYTSPGQLADISRGLPQPPEVLLLPGCRHIPHLQAGDRVLGVAERWIGEQVDSMSGAAIE